MTVAADWRFFCASFAAVSSKTPGRPLKSAARLSAICRETCARDASRSAPTNIQVANAATAVIPVAAAAAMSISTHAAHR